MVEDPLILQWHITEKCNLRCRHCYQGRFFETGLPLESLLKLIDDYKELLIKTHKYGHINLTGGEPLISPYFYDLLEIFKKDSKYYSFSILTNGLLIDEETAKKIAFFKPKYVQLSLEGGKKINDYIRGEGTYNKIIKSLKNLRKENIYTSLSFTASKMNFEELENVIKAGRKAKVNRIWTDRYIPLNNDFKYALDKDDTKKYLMMLSKYQKKYKDIEICSNRSLQFLETNSPCYHCSAGSLLITVMANGDVVPCRRLPIVSGNVLENTLSDIYFNSETFKSLRHFTYPKSCSLCDFNEECRGGLRCLTYAAFNTFDEKDPGCYFL